jgi:serine/threonine protein phosphatase PrpC
MGPMNVDRVNVDGIAGQLDWGIATRPLPGHAESGDIHFIKRTSAGWLIAVADGLGHGPEAATASRALVEVLDQHAEEPLVDLIRRCRERLQTTRGTAVSLASIETARSTLTWIGIGNVEGVLRHVAPSSSPTEYITQRGGIVGYRLPELQPSVRPLMDDDILVLATDGIREGFAEALASEYLQHPPQTIAERIADRAAQREPIVGEARTSDRDGPG